MSRRERHGVGREHHALELPGGAGGIEDRQQILAALQMRAEQRLMRRQQGLPLVLGRHGRIRHGDAGDMRRDTGGQLVRLIQLANQDYLAARLLQHIGDLFRRLQRMQRHADQSGELDRQVADKPFGAVLRQQGDTLTRHAAQRQQRAGQATRLVVDLAPAVIMPDALYRLAQPDGIGLPMQPMVEAFERQLQRLTHRADLGFCYR